MSRKAKYTAEQKVKACEDYLSRKRSANQIAQELNMPKTGSGLVLRWVKYYTYNKNGFIFSKKNSSYSKAFKLKIIQEYLNGKDSFESLSAKYHIKSNSTLRRWIIDYTIGKEIKDYHPRSEVYSMDRRKTTREERKEIVEYCLNHGKDYKNTAALYKLSYSQVFYWVKKYLKDGEDGLLDNRGKKKQDQALSPMEKQSRRIQQLERENLELQRRIELLKKVKELGGW